ncbi:birA [Wigglesworthia glossinidia endosymbiont of Glossina brevipalpis]|uniref:BirA protein n=1 Tax=Wigglesworthia glossinidia brevipalpis TaxID=36870 RepID=Q8D242_WIGBR|nr:birA [Wigglesworthia glossinidia endosymbiont of Glossina brevipalpis]
MIDYDLLSKIIRKLSNAKSYKIEKLFNSRFFCDELINKYFIKMNSIGIDIFIKQNKYFFLKNPINLLNKKYISKKCFPNKVTFLDIIDSTNNYIYKNKLNFLSGDSCIAEYQTKGRGKRGKKWFSSFGNNICLSMYWNSKKKIQTISILSFTIGKIIKKILYNIGISKVEVKFPNDIFVNDKKISGILIETYNNIDNTIDVIIGIGINLNLNIKISNLIDQKWTDLNKNKTPIDRNFLISYVICSVRKELSKLEI